MAEEKGEEVDSDEDEESESDEEEAVPYITRDMLIHALKFSKKSVSTQDLQKYMRYKRTMERRLGMDIEKDMKSNSASGASSSIPSVAPVTPSIPSSSAAQPSIAVNEDSDDDDIYGSDDD